MATKSIKIVYTDKDLLKYIEITGLQDDFFEWLTEGKPDEWD